MPSMYGNFEHYTHDELDAIQQNPERRDVVKLVAEIKRLNCMALFAGQVLNVGNARLRDDLDETLRGHLATKVSQWRESR